MENLFTSDVPDKTSAESPEHDASENTDTPPYPPPERSCYVCGQLAWTWNPGTHLYKCSGDLVAHEEREAWLRRTFPRLYRDAVTQEAGTAQDSQD